MEELEVVLYDIDNIPDYRIAEEERRKNEVVRETNEAQRVSYFENIQESVERGDFNGKDGANGRDGETGATFIPSVSEAGDLSWSNDKGLPNPDVVNIKGQDGTVAFDDLTEEQKARLKGDKGDKGEDGLPNVLNIGTVESGDVASATITGNTPNQTLNLVLPKGEKGEDAKLYDGTSGALDTINTLPYTPTNDYNPATKKYIDDIVGDINTILASLTEVA